MAQDDEEGYFVVKVEALPSPVFWEVELFLRKRLSNQPDRTKKKIPSTFRPAPESMANPPSSQKCSSSSAGANSRSAATQAGHGEKTAATEQSAVVASNGSFTATGTNRNNITAGGVTADVSTNNNISNRKPRDRGEEGRRATGNGSRIGNGIGIGKREEGGRRNATTTTASMLPKAVSTAAGGSSLGRVARSPGLLGWTEGDSADTSFREGGGEGEGVLLAGGGKRQRVSVGNGV